MKKGNFTLTAKIIDIEDRNSWAVLMNQKDCSKLGIRSGSQILMHIKSQTIAVGVVITDTLVDCKQVGIFEDLARKFGIQKKEEIEFSLMGQLSSLDAIQENLLGKELSYKDIYSIVDDIASRKLNDVAVAFFVASSFFGEISPRELYYLTKAMAETGTTIRFPGVVADKHSVGGLSGNETTPIIVPIIASLGIYIPKTCSRTITSASGTADTFEVLAKVSFKNEKLKKIVKKVKGCIVWGVGDVTPADSRIIDVASQLSVESYEKMVPSIMAKKAAMGVKYVVFDIPVNPTAKIKNMKEAKKLKGILEGLSRRMGIKARVSINVARGPIGRGIGPALQIRDDLRVLEQEENRPKDLEDRALELAGYLLEMTKKAKKGGGRKLAEKTLTSGSALMKMKEIIAAQRGNPFIDSHKIKLGKVKYVIPAPKSGKIVSIHNRHLIETCRILGTPFIKEAGIYLDKTIGERVTKGEPLCTMYTITKFHLNLALKNFQKKKIFEIK